MAVKIADRDARSIDYRLNILGIRVWEHSCQLIAKSGKEWGVLGLRWNLPVQVLRNDEELKAVAEDTLRLTAYQYNTEQPGSDLVEVLSGAKEFSAALNEAYAVEPQPNNF